MKQEGNKKDFSFEDSINQSIRYYRVPFVKEKRDVLNSLLTEITGLKIVKPEKNRARRLYVAIGFITSAACFLLFLLYFTFAFETYSGQQEANNVYYLPDQTRVVLSPGSQIRFSKLFYNRKIFAKGDAFFEVHPGDDFSVKSPNGKVKVLGTTFCVSEKEDGFLVSCFEGKVEVIYKEEERQLLKGDQYDRTRQTIEVYPVKELKFPEYVAFTYSFQNQNINDIWPLIEQYFGVQIYTDIPIEKRFTGAFRTSDLMEVMEIICVSLNLNMQKVAEKEFYIELANENS
ncbi:MAG TPA: FecR family protein [Prolixibacteraceae bacterium]|nr:FecR family protein [Prolixibacteraceae bacterium]